MDRATSPPESQHPVGPTESAQLCSTCDVVFSDVKDCDRVYLYSSESIQTLRPETCRLCAYITAGFNSRQDNLAPLEAVDYSLSIDEDHIDVILCLYTNEQENEYIRLALSVRFEDSTFDILYKKLSFNIDPGTKLEVKDLQWTNELTTNTLSESTIRFLKSKLKTCVEGHLYCTRRRETQWHPDRLLNIRGADRMKVYLEDTNADTDGPYFTLSHCWGNLQPIVLTAITESSLREGITIQELPKTFQEALLLCREFEVPYLWIDSMCIFQDNLADWETHAAVMSNVYLYAMCNIAASAAPNCSVGLSSHRDVSAQQPFFLDRKDKELPRYFVFPPKWQELHLELSHLNKRAWVMQERLLSQRVMHFTRTGVYFECFNNLASEVFQENMPTPMRSTDIIQTEELKFFIYETTGSMSLDEPDNQGWYEKLQISWECFLMAYTRCGLTVENDILVALNGIVQEVAKITGDRFVAGLWEKQFHWGLLWQRFRFPVDKVQRPALSSWRAPSWSWAGSNCEILSVDHWDHMRCDVRQDSISVEKIDVESEVSGQLKHASVTLKGRLACATLFVETEYDAKTESAQLCYKPRDPGGEEHELIEEHDISLDNYRVPFPYKEEVALMAVYKCFCAFNNEKEPSHILQALILRRRTAEAHEYERIGIAVLLEDSYRAFEAHEIEGEQSIIIV